MRFKQITSVHIKPFHKTKIRIGSFSLDLKNVKYLKTDQRSPESCKQCDKNSFKQAERDQTCFDSLIVIIKRLFSVPIGTSYSRDTEL